MLLRPGLTEPKPNPWAPLRIRPGTLLAGARRPVEDLGYRDPATHELGARRLDVEHHEIETLDRSRRRDVAPFPKTIEAGG
jgi:hypothetical protein